jgi:hypothetical protein
MRLAASKLALALWLGASAWGGCTGTIDQPRGEGRGQDGRDEGVAPGRGGASTDGTGSAGTTTGSPGSRSPQPGAGPGAGPGPTPGPVAACGGSGGSDPGPSFIRRLNHLEYDNTVRDLLGDTSGPSRTFPQQESAHGFNKDARALSISPALAETYLKAAEALAATATRTQLDKLAPCTGTGAAPEADCAKRFIERFGRRAFRRPVAAEDVAILTRIYGDVRAAKGSYKDGIEAVIAALLQSPRFLYRVELGRPARPGETVVALDDWEVASRLSYMLWNTMPDDALFEAAEAGRLANRAEIATQVRRMLADKRARAVVADFHEQWLGLDQIPGLEKADGVFPVWTAAFAASAAQETARFLDHLVWETAGDVSTIFTATFTFANQALAQHYGIPGVTGSELKRVALGEVSAQRVGVLGHAGLLARYAQADQTSPVQRGAFIRERLLCDALPPPPPGLEVTPPALSSTLTTRERFAQHAEDPACGGCHSLIDPVGMGLETFDAVGKYRAKENGKPVDASGFVKNGALDSDGALVDFSYDGAPDLAAKLARSARVRDCLVKHWFHYGLGREAASAVDRCSLEAIKKRFESSGFKIQELLAALADSDAFLYRRAVAPGGAQ